jgi:hypothetical protein
MSGPIPNAVASAATRMAAIAQCRAIIKANSEAKSATGASLPARTWATIPERTRLTLVMIASAQQGEPQRICRQPWESFSEADQLGMAAAARELRRDLDSAASLF